MLRRDLDRLEWLSKLRRKTTIIQEVKSTSSNPPSSAAYNPDGTTTAQVQGTYTQAIVNSINELQPNLDAAGRLKVSNPKTIFDSQLNYASATRDLLWSNTTVAGTSAFSYNGTGGLLTNVNERASVLVNLDGTGRAYRQTKQYFRYQPGKNQFIYMSFLMDDSESPFIYQRVGYFDDYNGLFLQKSTQSLNEWGNYTDPAYAFVKRSNVPAQLAVSTAVTDTFIQQYDWNLDTLDGSGNVNNPSHIKLNLDKIQTLVIELGWIESNRVKLGFIINGSIVWCHQLLYGNTETDVFIGSAHLPLRYELEVNGGDVPYLECISSSIISEGGDKKENLYPFSYIVDIAVAAVGGKATNTHEPLGINTSRESLFTLRPNITTSGSLPSAKYMKLIMDSIDVIVKSNDMTIEVWYIPDSDDISATFAPVSGLANKASSLAEYSTISTYSVHSSAILINSSFIIAGANKNIKIGIEPNTISPSVFSNSTDKEVAGCYLITGIAVGAATVYFGVNWIESY